MKLQELLKGVAVLSSTADGEAEIGEVRYDSRAVGKGDLFVAIRGYATDGHKYIEKALEHAQKDDIIVLMGKGHETYQEVNHVKHHMDDREIVAEYFNI